MLEGEEGCLSFPNLTYETGVSTNTAAIGKFSEGETLCFAGFAELCRFSFSGAATDYFTNALRAAARSVFSQVKSGNSRPKWP